MRGHTPMLYAVKNPLAAPLPARACNTNQDIRAGRSKADTSLLPLQFVDHTHSGGSQVLGNQQTPAATPLSPTLIPIVANVDQQQEAQGGKSTSRQESGRPKDGENESAKIPNGLSDEDPE